jgi:hypothetical protein
MSSAPSVTSTLSRNPMPPHLDLCHSLDPVSFARERLRFLRIEAPASRPPALNFYSCLFVAHYVKTNQS